MAYAIGKWLQELGLGKYAALFAENEIELDLLPQLDEADLEKLGLPMGPRKRLLAAISKLDVEPDLGAETSPKGEAIAPATAERRQLTVLFCDLVGSTALSGRLDPEDMREVLRRYQDTVAGIVSRHDGYVANYLGDGVLAYFGWPRAHEDQAAQAIRAGLAAVEAVAGIMTSGAETLAARVGIASGQVVVGDLEGETARQAGAVSGETPNLAARLQAGAGPGEVVIGGLMRRLVGDMFAMVELGQHQLHGIAQPVPMWRVVGETPGDSRFETRGGQLTRFVGREHELGLLRDRWQRAVAGEGQVVLLSGEAGIGKSRLMHQFAEATAADQPIRLRYQCAAGHTHSALYPVTRQLERAAGFVAVDDDEARLDKLESLLTTDDNATRALIATLLALPAEQRYGATDLTPDERKQRTLAALVGELLRLAADRPVLFLFEDAHWIDPTTAELMRAAAARAAEARLLMLVTHRPEYRPDWAAHSHTTTLSLNRVTRMQAETMVRALAGADIGDDIVTAVVARAEGIPLFVEELTKTLVERGLDAADADIPATLHASLTARIDRLGDAKLLAQVGAVIGREFDDELLAAITELPAADLRDGLDRLVASELVHVLGGTTQQVYTFKHALIQDTAYGSLTRERRRALHGRTAAAIRALRPERAEAQPEIVAQHYAGAGEAESATLYFEQAGRVASARTANAEALAHFAQARDWAGKIEDKARAQARQLDIDVLRGPVLMSARGVGADDVVTAYTEARTIAEQTGNKPHLFTILFGLWHHYSVGGACTTCLQFGNDLLALAEADGDSGRQLQAHHANWTTLYVTGQPRRARQHLDAGLGLYDMERHANHRFLYGGHDPGVCCRMIGALVDWILGRPAQAVASIDEFMAMADQLDHPFTRSVAHLFAAKTLFFAGDAARAHDIARAGIELSMSRSLPTWVPAMSAVAATAGAELGTMSSAAASVEVQRAMELWEGAGAGIFRPWFQLMAARVRRCQGEDEAARAHVAAGLAVAAESGEHWATAELLRIDAELLAEGPASDRRAAASRFEQALAVARRQDAPALQLRAATGFGRLLSAESRQAEAHRLLAPIYARFTEGLDMPDQRDAKVLLDELG